MVVLRVFSVGRGGSLSHCFFTVNPQLTAAKRRNFSGPGPASWHPCFMSVFIVFRKLRKPGRAAGQFRFCFERHIYLESGGFQWQKRRSENQRANNKSGTKRKSKRAAIKRRAAPANGRRRRSLQRLFCNYSKRWPRICCYCLHIRRAAYPMTTPTRPGLAGITVLFLFLLKRNANVTAT